MYRQYKLGNPLKRPDMPLNTTGTLHCGKLCLNRDRQLQKRRRSWPCRFNNYFIMYNVTHMYLPNKTSAE